MQKERFGRPDIAWIENPEVFQVGRLPAHSDHCFYESEETFRKNDRTLFQSLNGVWKFGWYPNLAAVPAGLADWGIALQPKDTISVPGHMELQGYGQIQYTNAAYPWDGHCFLRPPKIDWDNSPIGFYVREFDLSETLLGKRVCISFQGAEQAVYVWLNGSFIGYAEDSFTPSDFDITDAVKDSGNRLCVAVFKRSSASWIEDQDFFRFSGLFREVFLYGKTEGHIEDIKVQSDLNVERNIGIFAFDASLSGKAWETLHWELQNEDGREIARGIVINAPKSGQRLASETIRISDVHSWNVGKPYLYRLVVKVLDTHGDVLEVVPYKIGFRHFEIQDNVMLLNGRRLLVNGVNRHEWSPRHGRAITEEDMRKDIQIMKKNGINAVRTCHYPNQSRWYALCDEAGICVMDETNLESHGTCMKMGITETSWNIPGCDKSWEACCLDRARSMYERDKNHPSILWWSAGNESHVGSVIQKMCEYFHEQDASRLVHYEAVFYDRSYDFITDVESRMYPTPEQVREYLTSHPGKPMVLCEYMHSMGNSVGGLESYMALREEFDAFHGGFLWDFIDQALYMPAKSENSQGEMLGYGGDFGDRPTDYAFSANGLLFADRAEKPAMEEVRYWYLPKEEQVEFDLENFRSMEKSRQNAIAVLEGYSGSKRPMSDMGEEEKTLYHVPAGPIGSSGLSDEEGSVQTLSVAEHQVKGEKQGSYLRVIHTDYNLGIYGESFHYVFSFADGPVSLLVNGKEQLYRAPKPTFWRAPTENDFGCGFPAASAQWMGADCFSTVKECMVEEFGDDFTETLVPLHFTERAEARKDIREVEVRYLYETATVPKTTVNLSYRVNAFGKIQVSLLYKGDDALPDLPVFGMQILSDAPIASYTWDGLSGETYPDRYKGARFGTHWSPVEVTPYLIPQECGNHKNTVRLEVGEMVFLMDEKPFDFSVLPYSQQELEAAFHQEELPKSHRGVIRILGAVRGVGGIDSWRTDVEERYHVSGKQDISFSFYMLPKKQ